ncbi:MAG: hypothetical protein Q7T41_03395 [Candidatus Saccharibacteria bacterium]|nr:hypothetical protein [Candidatus Saccharibacteria bacterium]
MSFVKLPEKISVESLIVAASSPDSTLVPTVHFGYINNNGKVGLVRNSPDALLFLPRATLKPRIKDARASVYGSAINRFIANFGPIGHIHEEGIVIPDYADKIKKRIDEIERRTWRNAVGIVVVPVLVPVDMNNVKSFEDEFAGTKITAWEEPDTALEMLEAEAHRFNGKAGVSITSADALRVSMPFIPQVLESLSL